MTLLPPRINISLFFLLFLVCPESAFPDPFLMSLVFRTILERTCFPYLCFWCSISNRKSSFSSKAMAMAISSTGATFCIPQQTSSLRNSKNFNGNSFAATRPRKIFLLRSSSDGAADTAAAELEEEQTYIEAPEGTPSLISALNVERALRGIPITDIDHYGRLGIQIGCSYEQVTAAYENKLKELLNQGLDEAEMRGKMENLKESYTILSTPEERRMYDWSLGRSEKPDRYAWPYETDILKRTNDTPPFKDEEDVGPTRWVGYFFLGSLILSFTLSIVLNR